MVASFAKNVFRAYSCQVRLKASTCATLQRVSLFLPEELGMDDGQSRVSAFLLPSSFFFAYFAYFACFAVRGFFKILRTAKIAKFAK